MTIEERLQEIMVIRLRLPSWVSLTAEDAIAKIRRLEATLKELEETYSAEIEHLEAEIAVKDEALKGTTASLVAAISLLDRGGRKGAASDKMFKIMLDDYRKAVDVARAALADTQADALKGETNG